MKLLIGSRALKHFGEKYLSIADRTWDWDWICSFEDFRHDISDIGVKKVKQLGSNKAVIFSDKKISEYEIAYSNSSSSILLDIAKRDSSVATLSPNGIDYIATPDTIFALKKSHRYLKNSPAFLKTMIDYRHLRSMGCKIPNSLRDWYTLRVGETYNYKHPRLKSTTKDDFFKDDQVPYKYDHDTIHLAVKHLDQPAYNYFKPNTAEVECSREMFEALDEKVKLYSVLEESYVLALERSQIPAPGVITPKQSFLIALSKVCTSITSGWWREYAYENYFKVLDMYSDSYIDRFKSGVDSGLVKPFTKTKY